MKSILAFPCSHCAAKEGEPCHSVGGRVIVDPHMRRLFAAVDEHMKLPGVVGTRDEWARAAKALYETKVLIGVFGYVDDELRVKARKDRSIDLAKPWVKRALGAARKEQSPSFDPMQGALL